MSRPRLARFAALFLVALACILRPDALVDAAPSFTGPALVDATVVRPSALARVAGLEPATSAGPLKILYFGDSIWGDNGSGDVNGYNLGPQRWLADQLRGAGVAHVFLGEAWNGAYYGNGEIAPGSWGWHSAKPGRTIVQLTGDAPTTISAVGKPHVGFVSAGGNSLAGNDGPTLVTQMSALLDALGTGASGTYWIIGTPVTYSDSTSNTRASYLRADILDPVNGCVAKSQATGIARGARFVAVDTGGVAASRQTGPQFRSAEPSNQSLEAMATLQLNALASLGLVRPTVTPWPRPSPLGGTNMWADTLPRSLRPAQAALVGSGGTGLADGVFWTSSPLSLGSSGKSLLVQVAIRVTDVTAVDRDLVTLAAGATVGGFALVQHGTSLTVYADNGGAQVLLRVAVPLVSGKWHAVSVLLDQGTLRAYLYVDGMLRARSNVLSAWSFVGSQIALLRSPYGIGVGMAGQIMGLSVAQDLGNGVALPGVGTGTGATASDGLALQQIVERYARGLQGPPSEIARVDCADGPGLTLTESYSGSTATNFSAAPDGGTAVSWSAASAIWTPWDAP